MSALPHVTYEPYMHPRFFVDAYEVGELAEGIGITDEQIDGLHVHVSSVPLATNVYAAPVGLKIPSFSASKDPIGFFEPEGKHNSGLRIADQLGYPQPSVGQVDTSATRRQRFIKEINGRPLICLFADKVLRAAQIISGSEAEETPDEEVSSWVTAQGLVYGLLKYRRDINALKEFEENGPKDVGRHVYRTVRNNVAAGGVLSVPFYATGNPVLGLAINAGSVASGLLGIGPKVHKLHSDPRFSLRVPEKQARLEDDEDRHLAFFLGTNIEDLAQVHN